MDGLRLILLLVGALIIGGVYLYSRRNASGETRDALEADGGVRREPGLQQHVGADVLLDEDLDDLPPVHALAGLDEPVRQAPGADTIEKTADDAKNPQPGKAGQTPVSNPARLEEKIIVLNILPREPEKRFHGNDLLDVFDRAGLEYGRFDVFHRMKDTANGPQSVFVVASATEPGSFDVTEMADQNFKGISMFMVLPGPVRGVDGFADMLATARRIAQQLDADVKDRNRSTLTKQTAHHIREDIIAFEHRVNKQHS